MDELYQLTSARAEPGGFALFAKGFRPFFLLAALHAIAMIPLWLLVRAGLTPLESPLHPTVWHAHEMVFGFGVAVIAGFLLTAASHWTKRETAGPVALAALAATWLLGRAAMLAGPWLPRVVVAALALAFLPLLIVAVGRVVILARSKRNYGIVGALTALWLAQLATHAGALGGSIHWHTTGPILGVDLVILIVLVIGGRIIPQFTRNATKADGIRGDRVADRIAIAAALGLFVLDALGWTGWPLAITAAVAAIASAWRARRWGALASRAEPLLWVLHLGYAFVPIGFALRALAVFVPQLTDSTALHALTVGAIGTLTLGMMARVSLGHTGRQLRAGPALGLAFAAMVVGALVRVSGPIIGGWTVGASLHAAGAAWSLAFVIFLVRLGPALLRPRPDGKPG